MAESISIPLRHVQYLLDEVAPSWFYDRLQELMSMLIQIQQAEDCKLLQVSNLSTYSQKVSDIQDFAYHIDDQLDTIYINIESYRRWTNNSIPNFIKILALAYHKSRVFHTIRSLINLVSESKFSRSQNSDMGQWNEEQRLCPHLHHDHKNFSYDFEERISMNDDDFLSIVNILTDKNSSETIVNTHHSRKYVYVKAIYNNISIRKYFQNVAWVTMKRSLGRKIVYLDILKQLFSYNKKNDVIGLMSMEEDELWKELMEVLKSNKYLILLAFDRSTYDHNLVVQFDVPMRSRLLVVFSDRDMDSYAIGVPGEPLFQEWIRLGMVMECSDEYGWRLLESIAIQKS